MRGRERSPSRRRPDPARTTELLLDEFDADADAERFAQFDVPGSIGGPITYGTAALRRELGPTRAATGHANDGVASEEMR